MELITAQERMTRIEAALREYLSSTPGAGAYLSIIPGRLIVHHGYRHVAVAISRPARSRRRSPRAASRVAVRSGALRRWTALHHDDSPARVLRLVRAAVGI